MDTREFEEIQKLQGLMGQVAKAAAMSTGKTLFELGYRHFQSAEWAQSIATLKAASEIGDPYYSANALLLLAEAYRRVQDAKKEVETHKRIADLPEEFKQFIDPVSLGIVYTRVGKLENAGERYAYAHQLSPANPIIEENLAELLILRGDLPEALRLSEGLQARPEPRIFLVARILKALSLFLSGQPEHATEEFRWVAQYLMAQGGVPSDFNWDFRDSQKLWDKVDLKIAQLVVQTLKRRISLEEFRRAWLEMEPTPK
jgi:tetratricopeptide (TPR) repeat protein